MDQFQKINRAKNGIVMTTLKETDRKRSGTIDEQGKNSDKTYQRLGSNGSQPARLYCLAKVHRKDTPLRLLLSKPVAVVKT